MTLSSLIVLPKIDITVYGEPKHTTFSPKWYLYKLAQPIQISLYLSINTLHFLKRRLFSVEACILYFVGIVLRLKWTVSVEAWYQIPSNPLAVVVGCFVCYTAWVTNMNDQEMLVLIRILQRHSWAQAWPILWRVMLCSHAVEMSQCQWTLTLRVR